VPKDLELHLVLDNYATHKTPAIKDWLVQHPRFHLDFTPTSSLWLNLVERWFAELTNPEAPPLSSPQRHRAGDRYPQVDQRVEQGPEAIHLDQIRRRDPGNPRCLLPTHHRLKTLAVGSIMRHFFHFHTAKPTSCAARPLSCSSSPPGTR